MKDHRVWERQENESARAFWGFRCYRDLGPLRSLVAAYQVYLETNPEGGQKSNETATEVSERKKPPGYFTQWSSEYDWVNRSLAYDAYIDGLVQRATEADYVKELEELRQRQIRWYKASVELSEAVNTLVQRKIDAINREHDLEAVDIPKFIKASKELMDSAFEVAKEAYAVDFILHKLKEGGDRDGTS